MDARDRQVAVETVRPRAECAHCNPVTWRTVRYRRSWRRCSSCGGVCHWHDTAWVCDRCGDEWYEDHDPKYAPPGGGRTDDRAT